MKGKSKAKEEAAISIHGDHSNTFCLNSHQLLLVLGLSMSSRPALLLKLLQEMDWTAQDLRGTCTAQEKDQTAQGLIRIPCRHPPAESHENILCHVSKDEALLLIC